MSAPLFGLVLCGGESRRMGRDKSAIVYPELSPLPSALRMHKLLSKVCEKTFLSLRPGQNGFPGLPRIEDQLSGGGPAAALLAAHHHHPQAAWFVLACDFPFVDESALLLLARERDPARAATYFLQCDQLPEPLFAIWEPAAFRALLELGQSPRRTLERLGGKVVAAPAGRALRNVNSPEEAALEHLLMEVSPVFP
ncbi:MAG: NTP transferase domain-containing protein [Bdellovibrionota bacterium]